MRVELEEARVGMTKPSVARQLNQKITALEGEVETLRGAKKVNEMERKIAVRPNRGGGGGKGAQV
jgi:predicted metalloprotease